MLTCVQLSIIRPDEAIAGYQPPTLDLRYVIAQIYGRPYPASQPATGHSSPVAAGGKK